MFNLNRWKLSLAGSGTGSAVQMREDLNSNQLERGFADSGMMGYNPYSRKRKNPNQTTDNMNQPGDDPGQGNMSVGPGPGTSEIGSDTDRGKDAIDNFNKWFGGKHEYLWERQNSEGGEGSSPFMSGGEGEPLIDGTSGQQADSPIGSAQKTFREGSPKGNADNPMPQKRLPHGRTIAPVTQHELNSKRRVAKTFSELRRKRSMLSPLLSTWAHLKKGCVV